MAKTKSNRRGGGAKQRGGWSSADHDDRTARRIASLGRKRRRKQPKQLAPEEEEPPQDGNANAERPRQQPRHERPLHQIRGRGRYRRSRLAYLVPIDAYKRSHLAHDNFDKIDSSKLRLATAQVQRKIDALRQRLEMWDPVEEARSAQRLQEDGKDRSSIEYRMEVDARNRLEDKNARKQAQHEYNLLHAKHGVNSSQHRRKANLRKKPRPGPETWKLRGAARPAWEVYDFDVRYVDVHAKAHEEANARVGRSQNLIALCRGRFALDGGGGGAEEGDGGERTRPFPPPQPQCREFLSLLTQLGSLHLERKNFSSARRSFLEAIELEGPDRPNSVTNARSQLMTMYLSTNRPSSARKLWTMLENDESAWVRYSAALVEYVSWNLLREEGSSARTAERALARAVRGNAYLVYLLGWPDTFRKAMEYTDEVVDGGMGSGGGSILEAIEYGCCCYSNEGEDGEDRGMGVWLGTDGSLDWVRSLVLRALNEETNDENSTDNDDEDRLTRVDLLSWDTKLTSEEEEFERRCNEKGEEDKRLHSDGSQKVGKIDGDDGTEDEVGSNNSEEEEEPDILMYAGMFRTAMDWLQDAGDFLKDPSFDYISGALDTEDDVVGSNCKDMAGEGGEKDDKCGNGNVSIVDGSSEYESSDCGESDQIEDQDESASNLGGTDSSSAQG